MPVVGHQRVSTNPHRRFIAHFTQDALERLVVRRLLEQLHSGNATIQNVKYHPTRSDPCCSWHRGTIAKNTPSCQYRTCPAFRLPAFRLPSNQEEGGAVGGNIDAS